MHGPLTTERLSSKRLDFILNFLALFVFTRLCFGKNLFHKNAEINSNFEKKPRKHPRETVSIREVYFDNFLKEEYDLW